MIYPFFFLILFFDAAISFQQISHSAFKKDQSANPESSQRAFPLFSSQDSNSQSAFLPYFSNVDIVATPYSLINVTILIHGLDCNAASYFAQGMNFSQNQIIIVPWFGNQVFSLSNWIGVPTSSNLTNPIWLTSTWSEGGFDSKYNMSSFQILDQFIRYILKKVSRNGNKIIIAGFSAGAQFVQRYAWATTLGNDENLRFFVSNPSTYLYFNDKRPAVDCRPLNSGYVKECSNYLNPNTAFLLESTNCANFNQYKYGLEKADSLNPFITKAANRSFADTVISYTNKELLYVLGESDVCNCETNGYNNDVSLCFPYDLITCQDTYPDSNDNKLDTTCQGMIQGSNRLQRGLNYLNYLNHLCGSGWVNNYALIPGMAHDSAMYFKSQYFQDYGFGRKELKIKTICNINTEQIN